MRVLRGGKLCGAGNAKPGVVDQHIDFSFPGQHEFNGLSHLCRVRNVAAHVANAFLAAFPAGKLIYAAARAPQRLCRGHADAGAASADHGDGVLYFAHPTTSAMMSMASSSNSSVWLAI